MKNNQLLDLIGEAGEEYVLAADGGVIRPRFRWKTLAACAACAALLAGVYPMYQACRPKLHSYTMMEDANMLMEKADIKALEDGGMEEAAPEDAPGIPGADAALPDQGPPMLAPSANDVSGGAGTGNTAGGSQNGLEYDAPAQEEAMAQHQRLLQWLGGADGREPAGYPAWYAGAWLDNSQPDNTARLTVAVVDGLRTPELEAQIIQQCGGTGEVLLRGAKYSQNHLDGLMEPVSNVLEATGLSWSTGVSLMSNCLMVDLYSGNEAVPDRVLEELARLDPDGDAIRVRVYAGRLDALTDGAAKGPAPDSMAPSQRDEPKAEPVPGGAAQPQDGTQKCGEAEEGRPAHYDLLPPDE